MLGLIVLFFYFRICMHVHNATIIVLFCMPLLFCWLYMHAPNMPRSFFFGKSVCTPILQRNGDFVLTFLTLWFYPWDFKMKAEFTPRLLSSGNGVNFWINGQFCPYIFTSVSYNNCILTSWHFEYRNCRKFRQHFDW